MTCGIDEICKQAKETLDRTQTVMIEDLLADFNQEADLDELAKSPELRELRGALELFTVWLVHGRLKQD